MNIAMRILLVEDEDSVRYMFKRFIGDMTSKIVETGYLKEAMDFAMVEEFDIVILDLSLIDSGKEDTIKFIPELKKASRAPLVVVTGAPDPNIQERVINAGADFCIPKGEMFHKSKAVLMALHTAVLKHPRAHPGDDYMAHVSMLEKLVHAA